MESWKRSRSFTPCRQRRGGTDVHVLVVIALVCGVLVVPVAALDVVLTVRARRAREATGRVRAHPADEPARAQQSEASHRLEAR
jgi:hypothetical protein